MALGFGGYRKAFAEMSHVGPRRESLTGSNEVDAKFAIGERHHTRGCRSCILF